MKWRTLRTVNLRANTVFLRTDFNIAQDGGLLANDFRVKVVLPTVQWLKNRNCRIVIASHWGRPQGKDKKLSFERLVPVVKKVFGGRVLFAKDVLSRSTMALAKDLRPRDILFLENLRFWPAEEKGDIKFAKQLSKLADFFVNDAFGAVHRAHSSIVGLPKLLPSSAGLLLAKEVESLTRIFLNPRRPLTFIMGGAKASDKLKLLKRLINSADYVILGGILANTMFVAQGLPIGRSQFEKSTVPFLKRLKFRRGQLFLPEDSIVLTKEGRVKSRLVNETMNGDAILDIGPFSLYHFQYIIRRSKTVVWNGPLGLFEDKRFAHGTDEIAKAVSQRGIFSVVGGGDLISACHGVGRLEMLSHVSTGGGAMLEFLSGNKLPGLKALGYYD